MAAAFCVPKNLASKLKEAARNGDITVSDLFKMSSKERNALFSQYAGKEMATEINAGFERAILKKTQAAQKEALKKWAENTFTGGKKKEVKNDVLKKINDLDELGVLTPESQEAYLQDLVAAKLGAAVTSEEAAKISQLAARLEELALDTSEYGTPTLEYFQARKEMENYLDSLNPSSNLRVFSSTIGRGTMLLSVKSPLLNIESNTVTGFLQAAEKRIALKQFGGDNGEYARSYIKFVNEVYQKTGFDVTRMTALASERKVLGEEYLTSQGKGAVRKVGRVYEDLVFKKMLGAADVRFASIHFADSANLMATKMAKDEGLTGEARKARALALFKDATRIDPQTEKGEFLRSQAMADAMYATYTNESTSSNFALGIRKLFNMVLPDLRIGDNLQPFVKTPANVIHASLESSGVLVPFDVVNKMHKTIRAMNNGSAPTEAMRESFTGFQRTVVRAGLGLTFAYLVSLLFDPDDFIGEWPVNQKEQELLDLQNATTNSVRIGGKWISLDYFGVIAAPLVGMLYAKKYGNGGIVSAVMKYYEGVGRQMTAFPGVELAYDTVQFFKKGEFDLDKTAADNAKAVAARGIDFLRSRIIPGIVYDIAKGTDTFERKVDKEDPFGRVKNSLPFFRQQLPKDFTVLGKDKETENFISNVLFGSRVKTSGDDLVLKELERLASTGNLPSITDVSKTSPRAKELREKIGEERFNEAMKKFGTWMREDFAELITEPDYRSYTDDENMDALNKIKTEAFEEMLYEYGYYD